MKKMIAPSLMCAHVTEYQTDIATFSKKEIEYLHIDVMDGNFVPNLQFGTDTVKQLRRLSPIPLDVHLMIERPEEKLEWFDFQAGEYVSIHYESTAHPHRCLSKLRDMGVKPMLALNPATPLCTVEEVLPLCDGILLMTVNPGFAGQKIMPGAAQKVARLRELLDRLGYGDRDIEVDGNVSFENAAALSRAGANLFVAGSSSVYSKSDTQENNIARLRAAIL